MGRTLQQAVMRLLRDSALTRTPGQRVHLLKQGPRSLRLHHRGGKWKGESGATFYMGGRDISQICDPVSS